jgi:hypothetical protein
MAKSNGPGARRGKPAEEPALSRITVAGFKSIGPERSIEVRPLTLLAGANSSGKSSIMQPLLLLKQTLEAPYDPGALLLDGPNVRFTNFEQLLFRSSRRTSRACFSVGLSVENQASVSVNFCRGRGQPIDVESMAVETQTSLFELREGDFAFDPKSWSSNVFSEYAKTLTQEGFDVKTRVVRHRCLLGKYLVKVDKSGEETRAIGEGFAHSITRVLDAAIHLPGLRGNPERTYPVSAAGPRFIGTFENYVASIIAKAAAEDPDLLRRICDDLRALGLTWKVTATPVDDTQVELKVGRLLDASRGGARDLVNIADVGFGVSQTLPVVVALQVARPGQLVYIEQPELHLHPRAQVALARLLANAANRGVRVVAETHSSLLLLGVQSLVAEGVLAPDKVKLHWFRRNPKDGSTDIASADLDQSGAYGDWPEDFVDVEMREESRYTRAAHAQLKNAQHAQSSPAPAGD